MVQFGKWRVYIIQNCFLRYKIINKVMKYGIRFLFSVSKLYSTKPILVAKKENASEALFPIPAYSFSVISRLVLNATHLLRNGDVPFASDSVNKSRLE